MPRIRSCRPCLASENKNAQAGGICRPLFAWQMPPRGSRKDYHQSPSRISSRDPRAEPFGARPALRLGFDFGLRPPLRMTPRANARVSPDQACHSERVKHHSAVFCESNPTIGGRAPRGISPGTPPKSLCKETEDAMPPQKSNGNRMPPYGRGGCWETEKGRRMGKILRPFCYREVFLLYGS